MEICRPAGPPSPWPVTRREGWTSGVRACYTELMTDLSLAVAGLPEREQILILRSATHVAEESALPEQLRLCNHVTDLDAARLIHAIERGAVVVMAGTAWTDRNGDLRARMPHLTRIARECLRLGLVTVTSKQFAPDIWRAWLVAAPVHETAGANRTRCDASGQAQARRFRLTDDPGLIDCPACLTRTDA